MSIHSFVLYGSCARDDHDKDSDVDIFALSTEPAYRMIIHNKLNIACYPESLAIERAKGGDLFLLHIFNEGKVVYDTDGIFSKLKSEFQFKENYAQEIRNASNIGWLLVNTANSLSNCTLLNRRIAWCVRTILIAKSAERRTPCFSAQALKEFSGKPYVYALIKNKNNNHYDERIISEFRDFIEAFGTEYPFKNQDGSIQDYQELFLATENTIGLKTIGFLERDSVDDSYC